MFEIDKQFDFCYGHRVHNQQLNADLSVDGKCKCRHLHGHNGLLKIGLKANELERGMVTDFKNLECIKVLVDDVLDHKFIIDLEDPLFQQITGLPRRGAENALREVYPGVYVFTEQAKKELLYNIKYDISLNELDATKDKLDGLVIVKFVPTSENLCKMFAEVAQFRLREILGDRVQVAYVDFWETPKSHCKFTPSY